MPAAEDRQARALEQIAHQNKELVKIFSTLNANLVEAFKYIKEAIERDMAEFAAQDPAQMSIDDLRAQAEKIERERQERADFEESARGEGVE